jgi:hypothetical protein
MKRKNNAFIQKYMKWTVKSPITILTIIILGFVSVLYLVYTADINVYKTYEGTVVMDQEGNIYIQAEVDEELMNQPLYWYVDKQDAVYRTKEFDVDSSQGAYTIKLIVPRGHRDSLSSKESVYIDVPAAKITILSRIISRGEADGQDK